MWKHNLPILICIGSHVISPQTVWVHSFEYQGEDGSFSTIRIMFNNKKGDHRFSMAIQSKI